MRAIDAKQGLFNAALCEVPPATRRSLGRRRRRRPGRGCRSHATSPRGGRSPRRGRRRTPRGAGPRGRRAGGPGTRRGARTAARRANASAPATTEIEHPVCNCKIDSLVRNKKSSVLLERSRWTWASQFSSWKWRLEPVPFWPRLSTLSSCTARRKSRSGSGRRGYLESRYS